MKAVLTNLVLNAADAVQGDGTIRVSGERQDGEIVIKVADDGRGMPEEIRKRCPPCGDARLDQDVLNRYPFVVDFLPKPLEMSYLLDLLKLHAEPVSYVRILTTGGRLEGRLALPEDMPVKRFLASAPAFLELTDATLAAMIDLINRKRAEHIVTIEDPIEYIHENKMGMVRQREVGKDTKSFSQGLRAALRQDPDIIAIGEMRDYETIRIALTAAETGILVLSTLHTISIDKMLERLLSYAPPEEEGHIRYVLAEALQAAIHQELVPTIDGGKRVACEIMTSTDASRNIIRRKGTFMLRNLIVTGKKQGMVSMGDSLEALLREKVISEDTAGAIVSNYKS